MSSSSTRCNDSWNETFGAEVASRRGESTVNKSLLSAGIERRVENCFTKFPSAWSSEPIFEIILVLTASRVGVNFRSLRMWFRGHLRNRKVCSLTLDSELAHCLNYISVAFVRYYVTVPVSVSIRRVRAVHMSVPRVTTSRRPLPIWLLHCRSSFGSAIYCP